MMVDAPSACANLERLERDGCLSAFGFYEAVDYTPERLPPGQHSVIIRSYMAHHQGMAFASLDYLLHDRPMQRRFQSDPAFRSADLLLQERVPKSALVFPHPAEASNLRSASSEVPRNFRVFTSASTTVPEVHLLSNGRYHVAVTAAGSNPAPPTRPAPAGGQSRPRRCAGPGRHGGGRLSRTTRGFAIGRRARTR